MENQLLFETESTFNKYESSFKLIENGHFKLAYEQFLYFLNTGIDQNFIFRLLKSLKFWERRSQKKLTIKIGKPRFLFFLSEWKEYECFLEKNNLYDQKTFSYFKKSIFGQILDNFILSIQLKEELDENLLWEIILYFFEINDYEKAQEGVNYLIKLNKKKAKKAKFFLSNIIYYLENKEKGLLHLKSQLLFNYFFFLDLIEIPELIDLSKKLQGMLMTDKEIIIWLPVFALFEDVFPLDKTENKINKIYFLINQLQLKYFNQNRLNNQINARIIYCYLYLIEQLFLFNEKNFYLEIEKILKNIKSINENFYLKIKAKYE